ncbi:MAG: hypothetical protein LBR07_03880 [Puniceicoccales bacterium]|nr:hypothetical protein [Puniceicoccales bacterium]
MRTLSSGFARLRSAAFLPRAALAALAFFVVAPVVVPPLAAPLQAAKVRPRTYPNQGVFGIQVTGTAFEFYGRADHVLSISFQEYTTGPLFVSEVTIDMSGSNQLLRLYNARPVSEQDVRTQADNAAAATSDATSGAVSPTVPGSPAVVSELDQKVQDNYARATAALVVKTYPQTTHAKTVEFSVSSREELQSFFRNFKDLYVSRPLYLDGTGKVVAANTTAANGQQPQPINRIGGVLFVIE